ncbi:MAG: lipoate--protein ligase family protein [Candidatus Omnitrophica bacterium]|nr:lipoate--protein ligase family protein [Candidatus Omnitrophota bacterium]MBU1127480.1 lipoate--protein ligase family protein [Candidatus Omnitrophota bacterium]MBU1785046.1 lipoate--protein ligase family protein [Candidatus Omnitrophota bacterium]MBU1851888.1 lipoate--protein ligase family protein [Candidatus Omnitrophota bacterium]
MQLIEYPCKTPEELIALDEVLLLKAESGEIGETLRFWESRDLFVAVGRACRVEEDCFRASCADDGIKIIRRISGGGTVLQGPGCYNYSVILAYGENTPYKNVNSSYRSILGGISDRLKTKGIRAEVLPLSDLAVEGLKISGNAQARKRSFFLHHGTFLSGFDIGKVSRYLKHPLVEPEYRHGRTHDEFIGNIQISPFEIREIIKEMFAPAGRRKPDAGELQGMKALVDSKYSVDKWNYIF